MVIFHVSADEMTHRVQVMDHDDMIVVYVTTSQMSEITLERFEPVKVADEDIRFSKVNYRVIGMNCVVGKLATFRLQPISRGKDVVIHITLKYGNQSRTFSYTILAEETVPTTPAVAIPPPATESEPTSQSGNNDLLMIVLGATGNSCGDDNRIFNISNKAFPSTRKIEKLLYTYE
jgi:hypothetical protein